MARISRIEVTLDSADITIGETTDGPGDTDIVKTTGTIAVSVGSVARLLEASVERP